MTALHLLALYYEDLHNAFEYVGLTYFPFSSLSYHILYETIAAYAGYGNGLCSNYTDSDVCKHEQDDMPPEVRMAVLFTSNVLTVSLSIMESAYYLFEPDYRHLVNFTLGYNARNLEGPDEEYWDAVGLKLEQIMAENPYYERPAKVLLMDDYVKDETFQRVLRKALSH